MSETRPGIKELKDVGYRVILKNEDGSPRLVWRCSINEGQYGKFISIAQHWVRKMEGKKIVESDWAKKSFNFTYDKEKALATWNSVGELLKEALGVSKGAELEEEIVEEFSDELEGLGDEL